MEITETKDRQELIAKVEEFLGYTFTNATYLELALTHSSYANEKNATPEHTHINDHNERMEFLGDAVLELCMSHLLYYQYKQLREGALTKIRSLLVSTQSLAAKARELSLDCLVKLGHGEELQGGRSRESILSDTFEAVLAAVYEDGGFDASLSCVQRLFAEQINDAIATPSTQKDNKTHLQEVVQQRFKSMPSYKLVKSFGPEHAKTFTIELTIPNGNVFIATGSSYKKAEQEAARQAIEHLQKHDPSLFEEN